MPDVLIRNVPADDLARLDAQAARLGVSRSDYLRGHLVREARRTINRVSVTDLRAAAGLLADLADDTVMSDAWS